MKAKSLVFLFAMLAALCFGSAVSAAEPSLKIGAIFPHSGVEADIGREYERVIEMAVAERAGAFEVFYIDSAGDLERAIEGFHALLEQGIDVVLTVQSWVSNVIYPLAQEHGILHIALGSAVFDRVEGPDLTVRLTPDYKVEGRLLAEYLAAQYKRVAVVHMNNDYGQRWAEHLEELLGDPAAGATIVVNEGYDLNEVNFAPLAERVAAADPDVVVLLSTAEAVSIIRALNSAGVEADWVGTRPIERSEVAAEPLAEGLIFTVPEWDKTAAIRAQYEWKYHNRLSGFGAEAYDAIATLHLAVAECGSDDAACLKAWYVGRTYRGVLGEVRFDGVGDATYAFTFRAVVNGEFQDVQLLDK